MTPNRVSTPEGQSDTQRDMDELEKWAQGRLKVQTRPNEMCCTWDGAISGIHRLGNEGI